MIPKLLEQPARAGCLLSRELGQRKTNRYGVAWNSTWPVGCKYITPSLHSCARHLTHDSLLPTLRTDSASASCASYVYRKMAQLSCCASLLVLHSGDARCAVHLLARTSRQSCVWGLDDYHFLPFLWGAGQLSSHRHLRPKAIHDAEIVDEFADKVHVSCLHPIHQLHQDSIASLALADMLDEISGAKSWSKSTKE